MHQTTIRVRTYECDAYGHVNNAVYLQYLEYGRDLYLSDAGLDYQALVASGHGIWVTEAHLRYLSGARPGEDLTLTTTPQEVGAATVLLDQRIVGPDGRGVLEAQVRLVWVGPSGRPVRIPAAWREAFAATGA